MRAPRPNGRRPRCYPWGAVHAPLPIFVVAAAVLTFPVQTPVAVALLILAAGYAALAGGLVHGLAATAIAWGTLAHEWMRPDRAPDVWPVDAAGPIAVGLALAAGVALAGWHRRRLLRAREEAASASAERHEILERITDGYLALDREWRIVDVNARGAAFVDRPREELIGAHLWEAFPELVGSRAYTELYRAVADGVPVRFATESLVRPGRHLEVQAYPSPGGLSVHFQDVTDRNRATEALRENQERFRALIENAADIVAVVDLERRIRFISPAVRRVLGYSPDHVIGWNPIDLVHPEDVASADGMFETVVLAPRKTVTAELRFRHRDGSWRFLEYSLRNALHNPSIRGIVVNARDVTERKEAESAVRASEERYRSLVNGIPIGLFRTLPDGTILDANNAVVELLGYPDRQTLLDAATAQAFADPRDGERFVEALARDGMVLGFETRLVRTDGTTVPVRLTARAVRDSNGKVMYFDGAVEDISQRYEAEEAARKTLELFHLLQRATNDSVYDWDIAAGTLHWNEATHAVFAYSPEDIFPDFDWWADRLHPDDRDRVMTGLREAIQRGDEVWTAEYRFLRGDGTYASVLDRGHIVRNSAGIAIRMIGSMLDVTERKRAEDALRQSEERYRTIFEYAGDGILISDQQGRLVQVNERACRMTGFSREELLSMNIADLIDGDPEENAAYYRDLVRQIRGSGHFNSADRRMRRKNGPSFEYDVNAVALESGLIMSIVRDISERARAEEERRRLEEQLRQAQRMEAVGRLAGGIAHDFNNLLTAIQGYAEVLLEGNGLDDASRAGLEQIRQATNRAAKLTNQLLAFSRQQVLQPRIIDLNRTVREIEAMLVRIIGEDIELVTDLAPDIGAVQADPGQIEQVIVNLVVNARDAMPTGGRISIRTCNAELTPADAKRHAYVVRTGHYVKLTVADTGEGMEPEVQARIFEPFFTTKERGKGTGLGLSTVYGIVKQSGGYIWVQSEKGVGTVFEVYLPRVADAQRVVEASGDGRPERPTEAPRGTETVLLVEDEESVRSLIRKILEQRGYVVLEARSGQEALDLCATYEGPIDLLLTDVVMPEMSGRELAERLLPTRAETRVLFMSGYTEDAVVRHGIENTRINFLEKPFSPAALARKVREVLDMQSAPA